MATLAAALERAALQAGTRPAVLHEAGATSWRELRDRVARLAGALAELGVGRGETFALLSRNAPACFELMHAGYWLGAVPVPVNVRLAAPEIAAILEHARCRLVALEAPFAAAFRAEPLARWGGRLLPLEALPAGPPRDPVDATEDDVALLLYTGGTTGRSKGVPLTHRNILANALQVTAWLRYAPDDVYLHVAPMFHSADLLATSVTLQGGAHAFLPQFSPEAFMAAVARHRATRTMLAPAMLVATLENEAAWAHDASSLRQIYYGSSPMPVAAIRRTLERFAGVALTQGYGLTETAPLLTTLTMADHERALREGRLERLESAGRALPAVALRIADERGRAVPAGQAGEVWARGPNVAARYFEAPQETAEAFVEGWFRTGDVGRLDDEGYLTLLDRRKDMIITGGENVYSIEVESVLMRHPAVQEAAVIGVPDARMGEALLAVVVCRPAQRLGLEEMIAHCRLHIGGYKIPRKLEIVDALPRNALGKVLKPALRAAYRSGA